VRGADAPEVDRSASDLRFSIWNLLPRRPRALVAGFFSRPVSPTLWHDAVASCEEEFA
jgi:hypothetical protein